jgi:uncharacterized membrane protein
MSRLLVILPFILFACLLGAVLFLTAIILEKRRQYPSSVVSFLRRFTLSIPLVLIAWALVSTYSPGQWFTGLCFVIILLILGFLFYPPIKRMGEERRAMRRGRR